MSTAVSPQAARGPDVAQHPVPTLLLLTFVSGLVDAVSFVGLGGVFTANMTGNVLFLGFAVAGVDEFGIVAPLVSLGSFMLGAAAGGALALHRKERRRGWVLSAIGGELTMILVALAVAATLEAPSTDDLRLLPVALLAFAMGIRNATVRRMGVADLPTTILTLTITGLLADSRLVGGPAPRQARRALAIVAMFAGAALGALCVRADVLLALAVTAVVVAAAWSIFAVRAPREPAAAA